MAEYIEREAAIKVACDAVWYGGGAPSVTEAINQVSAADMAPVRHGVPMLGVRTERLEVYDPAGMLDGKEVFKRRIIAVGQSSMYCPFCGKRLCSRFFNYCPNCGAKMDEKETEE